MLLYFYLFYFCLFCSTSIVWNIKASEYNYDCNCSQPEQRRPHLISHLPTNKTLSAAETLWRALLELVLDRTRLIYLSVSSNNIINVLSAYPLSIRVKTLEWNGLYILVLLLLLLPRFLSFLYGSHFTPSRLRRFVRACDCAYVNTWHVRSY